MELSVLNELGSPGASATSAAVRIRSITRCLNKFIRLVAGGLYCLRACFQSRHWVYIHAYTFSGQDRYLSYLLVMFRIATNLPKSAPAKPISWCSADCAAAQKRPIGCCILMLLCDDRLNKNCTAYGPERSLDERPGQSNRNPVHPPERRFALHHQRCPQYRRLPVTGATPSEKDRKRPVLRYPRPSGARLAKGPQSGDQRTRGKSAFERGPIPDQKDFPPAGRITPAARLNVTTDVKIPRAQPAPILPRRKDELALRSHSRATKGTG